MLLHAWKTDVYLVLKADGSVCAEVLSLAMWLNCPLEMVSIIMRWCIEEQGQQVWAKMSWATCHVACRSLTAFSRGMWQWADGYKLLVVHFSATKIFTNVTQWSDTWHCIYPGQKMCDSWHVCACVCVCVCVCVRERDRQRERERRHRLSTVFKKCINACNMLPGCQAVILITINVLSRIAGLLEMGQQRLGVKLLLLHQLRCFGHLLDASWTWFSHVQPGGGSSGDHEYAPGIISLVWLGTMLVLPRQSWRTQLGRGKPGPLCFGCCPVTQTLMRGN